MLLLMLRSLVFAVSVAGYLMLLNKKFSVIMEFAPAVYCSSCVSLLYVAGLLNILPEMAAAITIGGVLCAVWGARAKLRFPGRTWCIIGCFGLVSLYFAYLLLGVQFTNTDNFTHWGLAIREMLLLDRMPNFTDEVILFQAYPMGTALWGYYVCRVVGLGDTCFAFVQQLMQLCFLLPLFAWITRKKWYLIFLPVSYALYAMCSNIAVSDLLVDSLLAIAAVALFAIGAYYRDRKETAVWCAMPMLVLLLQIKNSGVFFFAAYLVYILISWRGELGARKSLRNQFLVLNGLIPAASLVLWNKHVKYVFPNGDDSLHAMSASYFESVFGEKTLDEICRIFADVWASAASPKPLRLPCCFCLPLPLP